MQFADDHHSSIEKISAQLLQIMLDDSSLEEFAILSSNILKNPIIILDANYEILAHSPCKKGLDPGLDKLLENGEYSLEYITTIKKNERDHQLHTSQGKPFIGRGVINDNRRLVTWIYLNDVHLGDFVVIEANHSFGKDDADIAALLSRVAGSILSKNMCLGYTRKYNKLVPLLLDRIQEEINDIRLFNKYLQAFGLDIYSSFSVMVIDYQGYSDQNNIDTSLRVSLERIFTKNWTFYHAGYVIVFYCSNSREQIERLLIEFEYLLENLQSKAGISETFTNCFDIPIFYNQALAALQISNRINKSGRLHRYEDYKFHDMCFSLKDAKNYSNEQMLRFCCKTIKCIGEYDREHQTEYLKTLWTHMNNPKNMFDSAAKLYIHRNTVNYRLRKLEELFDIDFDNAQLMFSLYYSYILYDLF